MMLGSCMWWPACSGRRACTPWNVCAVSRSRASSLLSQQWSGATVNGLEAGQTFVIACAVMFHNLWELGGHAGQQPAARCSTPIACLTCLCLH